MGLAGVKNRSKIGNDPNNTKWARNTSNYGQRILRQQGWEAGQYLGQKDASHAALYTAASASHIKAVMREDNLGIGAAGPGQNTANQCTGLDIFKDLLGRLNGKSEESIEEQRQVRETAKMTQYVERRWGPMRFVRGGLLIGDEIKEDVEPEEAVKAAKATVSSEAASSTTVSDEEAESDDSKDARKKAKKEKKERKEQEKKDKKEKKEKKEKSRKRKADSDDEDEQPVSDAEDDKAEKKSKKDKKHKKDKSEKKEKSDRKEKKEKKKSEKKDKKRRRLDESGASASSDETEGDAVVKPAFSKPAAMVSSRHLARRRYINQKRAAVSDPNAVKQIFMITA
ncbi:g-patch domain containing protein [Ophiostoma piceae UAMH 11346]|uniref:PinX1-related protein 1 n=1 Tax=Ophiostoma piceae (strain UAMH 11346) TaxID=1262450 RepID=S3C258_OPHP1|nr:g-patch domain containing protein [Ophiostoma piceae UAMH 11346]